VPGQLAALCARLNLTGHGITVPPGRDLPERWLSMLTHGQRTTAQTAPAAGCAAAAAVLPDLDGIRLSVLGLTSSDDGTILRAHAGGMMRSAYYGPPEHNLAPAIWIRDSRGRWHGTRVTSYHEGDITMRLQIVPRSATARPSSRSSSPGTQLKPAPHCRSTGSKAFSRPAAHGIVHPQYLYHEPLPSRLVAKVAARAKD
jgi:hypothetical protein